MSSAGVNAINSGPLIIRTALDSSSNNTYVVGRYDFPISTNYVLTTSTNGILAPTNTPAMSSITVNSLLDRDGSAGATGEVLHTDGSTTYWAPVGAGTGYWSENGSTIYNNNTGGNVLIGATSYNVSTTFLIKPVHPLYEAAVKIELDGANLNIYKSTVNGGNGTFVTNTDGGELVLGTRTPSIFIEGGGNVGIHNSTPLYTLDVSGDARVTNGIYVSSNGIQCNNAIYTNSPDGGPYIYSPFPINSTCLYYYYNGSDVLQIAPPGNSGSIITFQTAKGGNVAEERMQIDSIGSVRIWNNAGDPSSLNVPILTAEQQVGPYSQLNEFYNHAVLLTDVNYSTNMFMGVDTSTISNGSGYIQAVRRGVAPTSLVLNPQGGNVGIGTSNPSQKLDIIGGSLSCSSIVNVSTINGAIYPPADDVFWSGTVGGNIYNDNVGNVGIGTSNPSQKLDIIGGSLSCSSIVNVSSINGAVYPPVDDALWSGSLGGNIYNDNLGNVGIGTSAPATKLHVQGSLSTLQVYDNNGSSGTSGQVLSAGTGGQVQWVSQPVVPGTVIYEAVLTYFDINPIAPPGGTIQVPAGSGQTFLQYIYVPKSSSSKIYFTLSAPYQFGDGGGNDFVTIEASVSGNTLTASLQGQYNPNTGGTNITSACSALLPISGLYNNTSLANIDIAFYADTGNTQLPLVIYYQLFGSQSSLLLNIREIAA
jgi:hypothetical protein